MSPNPLYLAGPTASGKTARAVEFARRHDAEIVCADPFQLFEALPLLTARPTPAECGGVPHHLYGTLPADAPMDAARFRTLAKPLIDRLVVEGRRVIVVGGSGLYLKALTHGLDDLPAGDPALRAELEARPLTELVGELEALDPASAASVDLRNPRRVIRALEICRLTGGPASLRRTAWGVSATGELGVWLDPPREVLEVRIRARTDAMFAAGVVDEVRAERERVGPALARAIGYREIRALLRGDLDEAACRAAIVSATLAYAKRQRTWFRKQEGYRRHWGPGLLW